MNEYNVVDKKIDIPKEVKRILEILEDNGFEAFAVGGCVRDSVLGRKPMDWDITTSALPMQVKDIFRKTIDTGLEHGTVTVRMNHQSFEVTTYRIDGAYNDARHPESVEFTSNLVEDLKRRDFTINAMAYNPSVGIVDAFGGIKDLEDGIIKCVGVASERFSEDALRILRAVRFSAQLGFEIEDETAKAIREMASTLEKISAERIHVEIEKLIMSDNPSKLIDAYNLNITKVVLPEFDAMINCEQNTPYHIYNVGEHTVKVMENIEPTKVLRWAALLHDVAKPVVATTDKDGRSHFKGHALKGAYMSAKILRRMRMDNKTIKEVGKLIRHHDDRPSDRVKDPEIVRRHVSVVGKEYYENYLKLAKADLLSKSELGISVGEKGYEYTLSQFREIVEKGYPTSIKEMKFSGKNLMEIGCEKGEAIGIALDKLLDYVLKFPDKNETSELERFAKKIIEKSK